MKQNEKTNKKNTNVCDKASDLYNNFPQIFFDEYYEYYQMLKKKKKNNLIIYLLKHIFLMLGVKMKSLLMQQEKVMKSLMIFQICRH